MLIITTRENFLILSKSRILMMMIQAFQFNDNNLKLLNYFFENQRLFESICSFGPNFVGSAGRNACHEWWDKIWLIVIYYTKFKFDENRISKMKFVLFSHFILFLTISTKMKFLLHRTRIKTLILKIVLLILVFPLIIIIFSFPNILFLY